MLDAAIDYLRAEAAMGGYEAWAARADDLNEVYDATARYLNCSPSEIAFTAGASDSWWRAFSSIPLAPGDRVLMSQSEFQANAFALLQARERGVIVEDVPNDGNGEIDLDALERMLDDRVKVVSLTTISMSNGAVQPAVEVGRIVSETGAIFLLDACQVAGQRPLDVDDLRCDFLCYTGRKFMRGMRGTGILYARAGVIDRLGHSPFVDGRSAEWTSPSTFHYADGAHRFEFGEQNFAGKVALGVATNYALDLGFDAIEQRITALSGAFRNGLGQINGVTVRDEGLDRCGIVTFTSEHLAPEAIAAGLAARNINVGAPGKRNAQLDIGRRGLDSVVRAGIHYFNTEDEVAAVLEAVSAVVGSRAG